MKIPVVDLSAAKKGEIELPFQFDEPVRRDLISRAVLVVQANKRQAYGASPEAGLRHSAIISKRRRDYRGSYGYGISRTPRKIMSRSGMRMNWQGAEAPNTVGGRRAHPPKAEKILSLKINDKERRKALRSAIAATVHADVVETRGHVVPNTYPFVVESSIESLSKTKDINKALETLGLTKELMRSKEKKVRAGKGKSRGRKYVKKVGPLLVVADHSNLMKAARNIPGVDIVEVKKLNAELLAPGSNPGRLTIWSSAAIEKMGREKLFA